MPDFNPNTVESLETAAFLVPEYFNSDKEDIASVKQFLANVWMTESPDIDTRHGVFNSVVVSPISYLAAGIIEYIDQWRANTQMVSLLSMPEGATQSGLLDMFLSNYGVNRVTGTASSGKVLLVFNINSPYMIGTDMSFLARQQIFKPTRTFSITQSHVVPFFDTEQSLQEQQDGTFTAVIDMVSSTTTAAANISVGTPLVPTVSIPGLLAAYAYTGFTGGIDNESDQQLIDRVRSGAAVPVLSSRINMSSQLRLQKDLMPIFSDSIVGLGDLESVRDKHAVIPIATGGRSDWYIRTSQDIEVCEVTGDAVVNPKYHRVAQRIQNLSATAARWRVTLDRDACPGFYFILGVRHGFTTEIIKPEAGSELRGFDMSPLSSSHVVPDIVNTSEAMYTRFQTAVFDFIDTRMADRFGDPSEWPTEFPYTILLSGLPRLANIQNYVSQRAIIPVASDILIKAPIPCSIYVDLSVCYQPGQSPVAEDAIKAVIMETIHNLGFADTLPASSIIEAVQLAIPGGAYLDDFTMTGILHSPSGRRMSQSGRETISFNDFPYATTRTISFFTDFDKISVSTRNVTTNARFL